MKITKAILKIIIIMVLLIGTIYFVTAMIKDKNEPLNKPDVFVYSDRGVVHWFDLDSHNGKITGQYKEKIYTEEVGKAPFLRDKTYSLTGETTDEGYEFKIKRKDKVITYRAWFPGPGPHLAVQMQGEDEHVLYNPVTNKELDSYIDAIRDYHAEARENKRIRDFFIGLRSYYGYLSNNKENSELMFIHFDETLLEGELSGTMLVVDNKGNEARYPLNGVTGGRVMELFVKRDGKMIKLIGKFDKVSPSSEFDLSSRENDEVLNFKGVSEKEYKMSYDDFKKK